MLIYLGCYSTCRENWGFTTCAVKNNLRSGIHIDQNALDLNYHSYVVEATSENRCMRFQDYHYIVRKGAKKVYRVLPSSDINLENELTGRSNGKREYAARTQFDCSNEKRYTES